MRRRPLIATAGALLLLGMALHVYRSVGRADYSGPITSLSLDLEHPDVFVRTRSLSQLPRDLLKVPLARDLLTEDFVFYYEDDPDRLGLEGSLRRIAYEHDLQWKDDLLSWVLDQPAEIALWRGEDGRLRHWIIALSRPQFVRVLQEVATAAIDDRQLSVSGKVTVDGRPADVFAFESSPNRTILAVGTGDRVVLLSEPGMLLTGARTFLTGPEALVGGLLSADPSRRSPWREAEPSGAAEPEHSVRVRTHYLSFGYQRFFPGFRALRFDFGSGGWSTRVLFDLERLPEAGLREGDLWAGVPANPAACALVPVDWQQGQGLLEQAAHDAAKPSPLGAELSGPAAVCWYPGGRLQAPLFVATLKDARTDLQPLFKALFEWAVRAPESVGPMRVRRPPSGAVLWQRKLQVPFAALDGEGEPEPGPLEVTLAVKGRYVFFSPDAARVDQALATLAKRYPSLADTLSTDAVTLGLLSPKGLAELGRAEALAMLPRGSEPVFRGAAERLLLPRLEAMGQYPPYRLALAKDAATPGGWQTVEWQEVGR